MSWFRELDPCDARDLIAVDEAPDEEIAEGVVVERRRVLQVSAGMLGALLLGRSAVSQSPAQRTGAPTAHDVEDLLAEMLPLARSTIGAEGRDETAYLFQVAASLSRLEEPKASPRGAMRAFRAANTRQGERFPVHIVQMKVRPGGRLAHHDHRDYNGVIVGVEGEIRVRNYDVLGDEPVPPSGQTFQIRETCDALISPGQFSTLARRRNNVHDLRAGPEGGVVLDVFTFFGKGAGSHWMDVEDTPRDAERRIYDAAWRGR